MNVKKHANEREGEQFQDNKACLSSEDNETASVHFHGKLGCGRVKRHYPLDEQNMLLQPAKHSDPNSREEREDREGNKVEHNIVFVKTPSRSARKNRKNCIN
ncbi:hypothetical protein Csa_016201 [Cucumis sativus]|nr:hypothetical protein Csa_016201 [Cucumis sativus]